MRKLTTLQIAVVIAGAAIYGVGISLSHDLPHAALRIAVAALSGGLLGLSFIFALSRGSDGRG